MRHDIVHLNANNQAKSNSQHLFISTLIEIYLEQDRKSLLKSYTNQDFDNFNDFYRCCSFGSEFISKPCVSSSIIISNLMYKLNSNFDYKKEGQLVKWI